jgi:hypothetical protein
MKTRICGDTLGRGCYRTLPEDRFYRKPNRYNPDYRELLCKDCSNAVRVENDRENPERKSAHNRAYRIANGDEIRAKAREAHAERADEVNAKRRERYATDSLYREKILAANRRSKKGRRDDDAEAA